MQEVEEEIMDISKKWQNSLNEEFNKSSILEKNYSDIKNKFYLLEGLGKLNENVEKNCLKFKEGITL